jgi:hypothetical protein
MGQMKGNIMETELKPLRTDEQGAVMVMALFMGIFLCALLFHLIGVGQSAVESQMAQDATDSLTFSAAAAKARGMNTIALINDIMALVLSILVALRLVAFLLLVAAGIMSALCPVAPPVCGAVGPLKAAQTSVTEAADQAGPHIMDVLRGLSFTAEIINRSVPFVAEGEAIYISKKESPGVSDIGFVWPIVDELPTEAGSFDELCGRAAEKITEVASLCLPGDVGDDALSVVEDLLHKMAKTFSSYFCGDGDPPESTRWQNVGYPGFAEGQESCDSDQAIPEENSTGCGASQLCSECAQSACDECLSRLDSPRFRRGLWQVTIEKFEVEGSPDSPTSTWRSLQPPITTTRWMPRNPCKEKMNRRCNGEPICVDESTVSLGDHIAATQGTFGQGGRSQSGTTRWLVNRTTYEKIFSCIVSEPLKLKTPERLNTNSGEKDGRSAGASSGASKKKKPLPRRLKKKSTRDDFRVWGVGLGQNRSEKRKTNTGKMYHLKSDSDLGRRITAASADFKSNSKEEDKMWEMGWYARMIRFRLPEDGVLGSMGGAQNMKAAEKVSGKVGKLKAQLEELEQLIAH